MDISRTKRFLAILINVITLYGLIIGGIILLATKRTSLGGLVMGYKFVGGNLFVYFLTLLVMGIIWNITFGIVWIIDIVTMSKRNGTYAEKLAGVHKAHA